MPAHRDAAVRPVVPPPPHRAGRPAGGTARRFGVFAAVGVLATGVQIAVLAALVDGLQAAAAPASAAGYLVSTLLNYALNRRLAFDSRRRHAAALPRFLGVAAVGLALNTAIVWCLSGPGHLHFLPAQLLATAVVLVWNFEANRRWTFAAP